MHPAPTSPPSLISVAPMMAWTDRHCRYLHRLYSPSAMLFTEMVTTGALLHGQQWHQLDYDSKEHPVALQLGGNDPKALAVCARVAAERGYDEINLNVGCPSDRVQQGTFGACLMLHPRLVADCVAAMQAVSDVPVSVKCRLGVDDVDSDEHLLHFIDTVANSGCQRFYLHMRKAILGGLTPAQNRSIPPLQPERAQRVKRARPALQIIANGGIADLDGAREHLRWADGVMIGRAAYHRPALLAEMETAWHDPQHRVSTLEVLQSYLPYMERELSRGTPLQAMTRHLLHCCNGLPGARRFRQLLSDSRRLKQNRLDLVQTAIQQVYPEAA